MRFKVRVVVECGNYECDSTAEGLADITERLDGNAMTIDEPRVPEGWVRRAWDGVVCPKCAAVVR